MTDFAGKFVSGLPGPLGSAPSVDPKGAERLLRIRTFARTLSDDLAPRCRRRFDGERWIEPEESDIAEKADCDAIVALVDLIKKDPALCTRVAAELAKGSR